MKTRVWLVLLVASLTPTSADDPGPAFTIEGPTGVVGETANVSFMIRGLRSGEEPSLHVRVQPLDYAPGRHPALL